MFTDGLMMRWFFSTPKTMGWNDWKILEAALPLFSESCMTSISSLFPHHQILSSCRVLESPLCHHFHYFNQVFRQWFTNLPCSICIVPWVLFGTYSESSLMCSHHASCRYLESPLCHHFHYLSLMSSHYLYFYHQHRRNLNELPCPLGNILSVWRSNRQVLLVNK